MGEGGNGGYPDRIRPVLSTDAGRGAGRSWQSFGEGWSALCVLVSGMAVWGAVGFGVDRLLGTWPALFAAGIILGHFAAAYLIYVKSSRNGAWTDAP